MEPVPQPAVTPIPPPMNRDWLLAEWVRITNANPGMATSITLQVGGLMVTGMVIDIAAYHTALGEKFAASTDNPEAQRVWRKMFTDMLTIYLKPPPGTSEEPPHYIHLGDARILQPNGPMIPHNQGLLWRGRIAAVDAWWFGSMIAQ